MKQLKLGLHSSILPGLFGPFGAEESKSRHIEIKGPFGTEPHSNPDQIGRLSSATIFDCRQLPIDFIEDTGAIVFQEAIESKETVKLPFGTCYFEFADEVAICASESCLWQPDENTDMENLDLENIPIDNDKLQVEVVMYWDWTTAKNRPDSTHVATGEFTNFISTISADLDSPDENAYIDIGKNELFVPMSADRFSVQGIKSRKAARLLVGTLALMHDKLLATEVVPDPSPKVTSSRLKKGKYPLSAPSRVLTINIGALRRTARATPLLSHESPCLHWRRGHGRVLHRGSEFESKTWVRRCLVGDPDRGYFEKQYKLTKNLPMMRTTELEPA